MIVASGFIGRLITLTFATALAATMLGATAFAQGNAAQDQYEQEPTQSEPSTAPATDTPGPDSAASASPDASQKSPTSDSTTSASPDASEKSSTPDSTASSSPDESQKSPSTATGTTPTQTSDTTAPSAPNASQECPWEPIPPGAYPGGPSGCPWWRGVPGGSESLGNGQCYDTLLGVIYSCSGENHSGESQTPNSGDPGVPTSNPGDPGVQPPNPGDPGIQTPNPGHTGGSTLDGGSPQEQGQQDQQKARSIRRIVVGLITGVVDLLSPVFGALQGDAQKIDETGQNKSDKVQPVGRGPVDASYCKQFPNDSRCRPTNTGGLPDEFKEAQDAQVGCILSFASAPGGWAAVTYHSIISPDPYKAISDLSLKALEDAPPLLKDDEMIKKFGFTPGVLESARKAGKWVPILLAVPDCIKFGKDSGVIGQYGLTKDLGLNKLSEMVGLSPGPSDTSKGIILSCNQFPGQSIDDIKKNCQVVSQDQIARSPTPSSGPAAPNNVHIESLAGRLRESISGQLHWTDNSDNEDEFRIYQNDNLVGTAPANASAYRGSLELNCEDVLIVSAYNANGVSTPVASSNKPSALLPSCR
jgi:hypothetical protein